MKLSQLGEQGGKSPKKSSTEQTKHDLGDILGLSPEQLKEKIISYMREEFGSVEKFDEIGIVGENGWGKYKISGVGSAMSISTKLGITGLTNSETQNSKGKIAVRRIIFPEAEETIEEEEKTKEETIAYMRKEFGSVEKFDEMKINVGESPWIEYKILGVGSANLICNKLGITGLSPTEKVGSKGKIAVRRIIFPEAEEIEKTREETIAYMRKEFGSVEKFDEMKITGWTNYKIPLVGGVAAICTKLGIIGLNYADKGSSKGKRAVRKVVFSEVEEIEKTREETIAYMREEFPTLEQFDEISIQGEKGWKSYSIIGVGGVSAICSKLGITGLSPTEKVGSKGKMAVRRIIFPEAEEIEKTREETIAYMRKEFGSVEKFDELAIKGENGWKKYNILGVGGIGKIGRKLGIEGIRMADSELKIAVRRIIFPEAEETIEEEEKTREETIAYMRKEFGSVEKFDELRIKGSKGWESYRILGVGSANLICNKLGITGLSRHEKRQLKGKIAVRRIIFPEAEEILTQDYQEQILDDLLSSQELEELIAVLGPGVTKDILYAQDQRVKNISIEVINSKISEYLGDFVSQKSLFDDRFWNAVSGILENISVRESLLESLKQDMLYFYTDMKVAHPNFTDTSITDNYIQDLIKKVNHIQNPLLHTVIEDLQYYISQIHSFQKPDYIIHDIDAYRELPDFGQKINIAETQTKKRLLIADEMGLGKSASAILSKEMLGVKKALIIAPHNVIPVWQGFLSDDPGLKGLFVSGQSPNVVEITKPEDMIDAVDADYILISQHKLNENYKELLKKLGCTMVIVDEQHKLKNAAGVWSNILLDIVDETFTLDDYVVLLSGTPSPNKVSDIAMALKLLYPEDAIISKMTPQELKRAIIEGNMLDLRGLLAKKMQAKRVVNSVVKLPALHETIEYRELTDIQQKIYESLLDEDELTATEKLRLFWRFLHNPKLLDINPNIGSLKVDTLRDQIHHHFNEGKKKIVVFVNQGISNVIAGDPSLMILSQLGLDEDVSILSLHGQNQGDHKSKKIKRAEILHNFQHSDDKTVLFVSGLVGDVGIDLTAGEVVIHYDEPWTLSDKNQQVKRVHRSGLQHEVQHKTIIAKNTIDEGIHYYIMEKQKIIDKLIYGIPLNEIEKELLYRAEQGGDNPEHNRHLAEFYMSMMQRLNQHFGYMKDMGTEKYSTYLESYAKEYAEYYSKLGAKSYQANVNRVSGTLIDHLVQNEFYGHDVQILDLGSGPCVLKKHVLEKYQSSIISVDGNKEHFTDDMTNCIVASFDNVPVDKKSFDIVHMGLAFQDTGLLFTKKIYDRVSTLLEINRILKDNGITLIQLPYGHEIKNQEYFEEIIEILGFEIYQPFHGIIKSSNTYESNMIALRKIYDPERNFDEIIEQLKYMKDGLKIVQGNKKLINARKIISQFEIGQQVYDILLNEHDTGIASIEENIINEIKILIEKYGSIKNIPLDIVKSSGFIWFAYKPGKYKIIKILNNNEGLVEYKE